MKFLFGLLFLTWFSPAIVDAADGTWSSTGGGRWSDASNWTNRKIASGSGSTTNFATLNITADVDVQLDGAQTIATLKFGDKQPSHGWNLIGQKRQDAVLTLEGDAPTITVQPLGPEKTVACQITLAGSGGWTKNGAGGLTLNGPAANTITGTTKVDEGMLVLAKPAGVNALASDNLHIGDGRNTATVKLLAANQLPDTTDVTIFDHGTFDLGGCSETINNLLDDGSGGSLVDGGSGEPVLTLGAGDFAGTIKNTAGALTVHKSTRGVLFLRGDNKYSGNTTVSEGVLALAGASSNNIASSPLIRVETGATLNVTGLGKKTGLTLAKGQTLEGSGTVRGKMTISEGSKVSPGSGIGKLIHQGEQVWSGGGGLHFELGETRRGAAADLDFISIQGQLRIGATQKHPFEIEVRGQPGGADQWILASAMGGITLEGEGAIGERFRITAEPPVEGAAGKSQLAAFAVEQQGNSLVLRRQPPIGSPPDRGASTTPD